MKQRILKYLKNSLIAIALLWFILANIISFVTAFSTPQVYEVYRDVPEKAGYCHSTAGFTQYYPVTREHGYIDFPNRALFGLLPVTHMVFAGEYIDEGYLLYHQYFLFIPIGLFEFPCSTTQWP